MSQTPPPLPEARWGRDLALLAVLFGVLFAWELGGAPLANPDEGRYAEVPREMVASGDWVTPHLDGVPYFEKPPLVYWLVAACESAFGPGEGSLRLVPAAFALMGVLLTYAGARAVYGRDAGFWAAVVLGTSLLYAVLSRLLILDMVVSVLMSATLFCFILGVRRAPGGGRRALFYGLYVSAALATLAKGLIGFLVTGAVMLLWLVLLGQWRRLRPLYLPSGAILFLAVAAPWHLLAASRNPGWASFYFVHEHWQRFVEKGHSREGPLWYFIPVLLLGLFPWTGFAWSAGVKFLRGGWARRREAPEAWFFALWAGFIFVFFSVSHSKLIPYILPVFPAFAVLTGAWISSALLAEDGFERLRAGLRVFGLLCGMLAAALCVAVLKPGIIRDPSRAAELKPYAFVIAALLCVGAIRALVPRGDGRERARGSLIAVTATFIFFFGALGVARSAIQSAVKPGTQGLALVARQIVRPGDRIYHYHNYFQDFPYYSGKLVDLVDYKDELETQFLSDSERRARFVTEAQFRAAWALPGRAFVVVRVRDAASLFADKRLKFTLIATGEDHYLLSNQP